MQSKTSPKIADCKPSDNWTCITFKPDLEKFGMTRLDQGKLKPRPETLIPNKEFSLAGVDAGKFSLERWEDCTKVVMCSATACQYAFVKLVLASSACAWLLRACDTMF
jgi:hypothetical protein